MIDRGWRVLLASLVVVLLSASTAVAGRVTIAWQPNKEADLAGYLVCVGTAPGVYTSAIDVGNTTIHTVTDLQDGLRYYFAVKAYNTSGMIGAASQEVYADLPAVPTPPQIGSTASRLFDFNGDGNADVALYRPSTGTWLWFNRYAGGNTFSYVGWGTSTDLPVRGDYDGDGIIDAAVYRPSTGTWFVLQSSSGNAKSTLFTFGASSDTPVPGDYDGDGKTDGALYRPSAGAWYIRPSSGAPPWSVSFGATNDVPVPADYDGDHVTDVAVYRPSTGSWFILTSSSGYAVWSMFGWGDPGDQPVPGDYDGDGKADIAVFRPTSGTWFVVRSSTNNASWIWYGWGTSQDTPVPADYDGDGITDFAVFRASTATWYVLPSSGAAPWKVVFGASGDIPLLGLR